MTHNQKYADSVANESYPEQRGVPLDDFFADGGKYMKFVQVSGDGSVAAEDRLKVGKEYKIGVVLSINVEGLRNDLQATGMIKSLSSGF